MTILDEFSSTLQSVFENEILHKNNIYLCYDTKTKVLLEIFVWEFCKITSKVFAHVGT